MSLKEDNNGESKTIYETIWRELVDLYPFTEKVEKSRVQDSGKQRVES